MNSPETLPHSRIRPSVRILLASGRAGSRRASLSGFTLMEVLVVCAIISILAGMITVGVQYARGVANVRATRFEIQQLVAACESYKSGFGYYPPSSLASAPLGVRTNAINEGIESLLAYTSTQKKGGPFLVDLPDDRLTNTDADRLTKKSLAKIQSELAWTRGNDQLLEYCDMWGNPFVYIHHRDYKSKTPLQYVDADGKTVTVKAASSEKTGTFVNSTSVQIWSFGPNRINENGEGDDVVSWRE